MIRKSLVIIIGLVITMSLEAKKINGQILLSNDTIEVIFDIPIKFFSQEPNFEKLQGKVKFYDANNKRIKLSPDSTKEIRFKYEYENIRMISLKNTLGLGSIFSLNTNIFLRIEIDGQLKLYRYYYTQNSPGMYNASTGAMMGGGSYSVERSILQKGNGTLKRPNGLGFKKDMVEYFKDCPILSDKIENKIYKRDDLEAIVVFYNSNCK